MRISLVLICLSVVLFACTAKWEKELRSQLVSQPNTQQAIDKNLIIQYLLENKIKAKNTESGIYYTIDKEGEGDTRATVQSSIKAHYKGTLLDGTQFDSSYDRGRALDFRLQGVIQGWQEAIPLLKKGGKGTFIIPSGLAYGRRSPSPAIPANSVLIFEIELIDFN